MPVSLEAFRCVTGSFHGTLIFILFKKAKRAKDMFYRTLKLRKPLDGVAVSLFLTLIFWGSFLHRCGDIEKNPGPNAKKGVDSSGDADMGRITRYTTTRGGSSRSDSVDSRIEGESGVKKPDAVGQETEPSLRDVMSVLSSLNTKFDGMKEDLKEINEKYGAIKQETEALRSEVSGLRQENERLHEDNSWLWNRLMDVERKADDLECRSKRNNFMLYGLPRKDKETWEECEASVNDMVREKLGIKDDVSFDRVHRVNSKSDAPVVARCTFYKDKDRVMRAKQKLKGTKLFISEDFSDRVRAIRKKLSVHLKEAKSKNKKATMVYDHLVIEGKKYDLNSENQLVERNK